MAEKKMPVDRQNNKSETKKPKKKRSIIKIIILIIFLLLVIGGGAAAAVVYSYISEAPPFDASKLATVETSYLYDSSGAEITRLHEEQNRIVVSLDEIPAHVQEAFIAIEDERFKEHFGFDIIGSLRAAYANLRAGGIVQGATTITQEVAQHAFLSTETSYKRKIQEIWLAIEMERRYSKEEILELYLNRMYFGNGAYGVEAAAQTYFGKSVGELSIAEGAMLAGAMRWPNNYNPFDNREAAEERMHLVLNNMLRLEYISEAEYQQALQGPSYYAEPRNPEYPYPHFVDYVIHDELIKILSEIPSIGSKDEAYRAIYTGGLRIHTTLDPHLQHHVEEVLARDDLYPATIHVDMAAARETIAELPSGRDLSQAQLEELIDEEKGIPQPQAAIVLADPTTGEIKALGGGRKYRRHVDEILRFTTLRQPGSCIKPIITYAPAFEEGVLAGAGSTVDDAPYIGPRGDWFPENFDYKFRGMITAREALYYSYNIPAIRIFEALGSRVGVDYAEKMGISTFHPDEVDNLALTLGALTYGVSAIDMAQAYSVLANQGVKVDLHSVEKIIDRQGNVLFEQKTEPQQIVSPQSAFLVSDILQDFVTRYLGRALQIDRPVAAKTGTTEDWKDVYLAAYTPNLVATFWMGYDEPKLGSIQQGWRYSTAFLREVFLEAFQDLEIVEFEQPEGIVRASVCNKSGLRPNESCQEAGTVIGDYFIEGRVPGQVCNMHQGVFYNRPPYIITDDRWSSRGGPGRGPEDAKEMLAGDEFGNFTEQWGQTTSEISLFNAYVVQDGATLQWQYEGANPKSFELRRAAQGAAGETVTFELEGNTRQYTDTDLAENTIYTYTLAARLADGTLTEPATVYISTAIDPDGRIDIQQPGSGDIVVIPNITGVFQAIAEMRLSRLGLKVGIVEHQYSDTIPNGQVISQVPAPGSIIKKGRDVKIVVSKGPETGGF
ncbi:MAG: PBP1A family penicillin-binding protein [Bacillota bacterium]|nr:PBP1A family penicillin-binding protein [Bacillota bacterium]